jgi:hypothetical protein
LNPIKRKYVVDITAEQLNLPIEMVDDIVSHFYQTLQKKLSSVEHHSIMVPRLGTFVVKKKSLDEKLLISERFVAKIEKDDDISVHMYEMIIQRRADIEKLKTLQSLMQEERNRKEEVLIKKQVYRDGKLDQNLEGPK